MRTTKGLNVLKYQQLMSGAEKFLVKGTIIVVDGKKFGAKEVKQLLQPCVDAINDAAAARAVYRKTVAAERAANDAAQATMSGLVQGLRVMYASSTDTLAEFGLETRKTRRALTVEEKVTATVKARATRDARHTMGKVQKQKVKGSIAPAASASGAGDTGATKAVTTAAPTGATPAATTTAAPVAQ